MSKSIGKVIIYRVSRVFRLEKDCGISERLLFDAFMAIMLVCALLHTAPHSPSHGSEQFSHHPWENSQKASIWTWLNAP